MQFEDLDQKPNSNHPASEMLRWQECEKILAGAVNIFVDRENCLSKDEELATDLGFSMLSALLLGLKYCITQEAKAAVEEACISYKDTLDNFGISECLSNFGEVPPESNLPRILAYAIMEAWPIESTMDDDVVGDGLKFFEGCTRSQVEFFLEPMVNSHRFKVIADRIRNKILILCPDKIPYSEYCHSLKAYFQNPESSKMENYEAAELLRLLPLSPIPRDELRSFYLNAFKTSLESGKADSIRSTTSTILQAINDGNYANLETSMLVASRLQTLFKDQPTVYISQEYFKYLSKFHTETYEDMILKLINSYESKIYKSTELASLSNALAELKTAGSDNLIEALSRFMLLGNFRDSDYQIMKTICNSPNSELKGNIVNAFLEKITFYLTQECRSDDEQRLYERSTFQDEITLFKVCEMFVLGKFSGDSVFENMKSILEDEFNEPGYKKVFAARLIAGHESEKVEDVLFNSFCNAHCERFRQVIGRSLSKRLLNCTSKLIELASDTNIEKATSAIAVLVNTQDETALIKLKEIFLKSLERAEANDSDAEKICIAILKTLSKSKSDYVDSIFFGAFASNNHKIASEADRICFSKKKFPNFEYRDPVDLIGISKLLFSKGNFSKNVILEALNVLKENLDQKEIREIIESRMITEIDEEIYLECLGALASFGNPEHLKNFLRFLDLRKNDPTNRPSAESENFYQYKSGKLNRGDFLILKSVMSSFSKYKKSHQVTDTL